MPYQAWNNLWMLFMSDPVDFLILFTIILGAVGALMWFVWWLRGFIHSERIATKDDQIALAITQREHVAERLAIAEANLALMTQQIEKGDPSDAVLAAARSTSQIVVQASNANAALGVTLSLMPALYRSVTPDRPGDQVPDAGNEAKPRNRS